MIRINSTWVGLVSFLVVIVISICGVCSQLNVTIPNQFGTNIHFTEAPKGALEMLAGAGWQRIRMDFFWAGIETKKGVYDFSVRENTLLFNSYMFF